jgi:hypothetical protein
MEFKRKHDYRGNTYTADEAIQYKLSDTSWGAGELESVKEEVKTLQEVVRKIFGSLPPNTQKKILGEFFFIPANEVEDAEEEL